MLLVETQTVTPGRTLLIMGFQARSEIGQANAGQ
jgi:hypothetical protein